MFQKSPNIGDGVVRQMNILVDNLIINCLLPQNICEYITNYLYTEFHLFIIHKNIILKKIILKISYKLYIHNQLLISR